MSMIDPQAGPEAGSPQQAGATGTLDPETAKKIADLERDNAAGREELRKLNAEKLAAQHELPASFVPMLSQVARDQQEASAEQMAKDLQAEIARRRDGTVPAPAGATPAATPAAPAPAPSDPAAAQQQGQPAADPAVATPAIGLSSAEAALAGLQAGGESAPTDTAPLGDWQDALKRDLDAAINSGDMTRVQAVQQRYQQISRSS